jgi:N-formylglutamate amidohydrolase
MEPKPVYLVAGQSPVMIALPHSGSHYPDDLRLASTLSLRTLRRSEDAFLDQLYGWAPEMGMSLVSTPFARAYVDVNRDAADVDPQLTGGDSSPASDRARAGLGVVPRIVGQGVEIYSAPVSRQAVTARIEAVHRPYHHCLQQELNRLRRQHGFALLLDCHSMPSAATMGRRMAPVVLGDLHGRSCDSRLTGWVEEALRQQGFVCARNDPYAGGYTTSHYGRPAEQLHVLQIELDRSLYMDELRIEPHAGLPMMRQRLHQAIAPLISKARLLFDTRYAVAAE